MVKRLSEGLACLGHSVTVATSFREDRRFTDLNGVRIEPFKIGGNEVRGYEAESGEIERYRNFVKQGDFDVVVNFAAQQWATDLCLPILPEINARKVSVPTGFSGFYNPEYQNYFERMKGWIKHYDANVCLSDGYVDVDFARQNGARNIIIIPNGASAEEFSAPSDVNIRKELGLSEETFLILTVGSHTGLKGHKEAIEVFKRSALESAALLIIGNPVNAKKKSEYSLWQRFKMMVRSARLGYNEYGCEDFCKRAEVTSKNIFVRDWPREKTVQAFKQSDLFLFLSNIECSPIVLFEAMAGGTAFVSTDVGNAREIAGWSGSGLIVPTEKKGLFSYADITKSVQVIRGICQDRAKREELAQNGFRAWKEKFTWEKITVRYEELYKSLLDKI